MKATEPFYNSIKGYLDQFCIDNPEFEEKYENKKKNIKDCITYILNQVKNSGSNGFHDREIYGMALHYYDEEKIDVGKAVEMKVKVNHFVELTPKEIENEKVKARNAVFESERARMKKKPSKLETAKKKSLADAKTAREAVKEKKSFKEKVEEKPAQGSLF